TVRGPAPWRIDFLRADYLVVRAKTLNDGAQGFRDATDHLRKCENRYASHKDFWRELSVAYQRLKSDGDADRALQEFRNWGGDSADLAVIQSRLVSLRGDDERAKNILSQALSSVSNDREKLRQELLRLRLATRDFKPAREMLIEDYGRQR